MADFAHTRRWWPSFLLEEVMPEGREHPQDWLRPDAEGVTLVLWDEDEPGNVAGTISPGETIAFSWQENRGRVTIRIMPGGTWNLAEGRCAGTSDLFSGDAVAQHAPTPAGSIFEANQFWEPTEWESSGDSMDEFARTRAENEPPAPDGDLVEVAMGFWSNDVLFTVSADGRSLERAGVSQ